METRKYIISSVVRTAIKKALNALKMLDEHGIRHSLSFTINQANKRCIDHIIDLCIETEASTLNFNINQLVRKSECLSKQSFIVR